VIAMALQDGVRTEAGQKCHEWRKLRGISCSALAAKCGLEQFPGLAHRILRWEHGEIELSEREKDAVRSAIQDWEPGDTPWWAR